MPNDKVIKLHSYLKSQDVTVPESVDEFEKGLNEERITKLHSYLRDNDVVVPEDVSEFSSALKKKGQAGQSQEPSGSDSETPYPLLQKSGESNLNEIGLPKRPVQKRASGDLGENDPSVDMTDSKPITRSGEVQDLIRQDENKGGIGNNFNTTLSGKSKDVYENISKKLKLSDHEQDYDMRGWVDQQVHEGKSQDAIIKELTSGAHFTDTFKKPNHPTFSDQSQYHNEKTKGGKWVQEGENWSFIPSEHNVKNLGEEGLRNYFKEREPNSRLLIGGKGFDKPGGGVKIPSFTEQIANGTKDRRKAVGQPTSLGTTFDVIRNAIDQGSAQGDVENTFKALYDGATPEELKAFTEANKRIEKIQTHPSVKKFEESEGTWGWVSAFAENPMDIALHLMTKSTTSLLKTGGQAVSEGITTGAVGGATIGTMVTPGIGTAAGFVGGASAGLAAGMAKAGFDAGMASDMVQSMKDSGIDIKDPKSVEKALKDKDKMDAWQKHALKYNIPIAAFDLFSAGLGGKIFAPAKSVGSKIAKGIAETAIQAGLDASGEAAGQLAADKRLDAKGIFSEVAGGLPQQAVEVATGMLNNEKPVNATLDKGEQSISNAIQYKLAQGEIASKKAEILASLEPDGNGGVIMTPEAKAELDKLENARVQVQEPTQQSATNTEGAQPGNDTPKQQEPTVQPTSTEANKGATIESAVIEIGGQTFEGKNHAEAILKAQQAGKDISQVDRQGEGMFRLSDGTVISREQAKETFGADKAEMLITQDDNANKANDDYEKVKTEFKREDIANKIASNDTGGIANTPIEDVPLLVQERTNPTENVLTVNPIQESNTPVVEQPTITGTQEQEGTTGVQAVSENVQEAGTTDTEGVSVGKTSKNTIDARGKLNERAKALGYDGIKQFNTQNVLNENLNEEEKQLLDDYSSHTASVANEKDSSVIESMNDEDFGHWAKSNDVQRGANGTVNNTSDLDLAKKRINILNKRGNKKQADIEQKSLELSKKKDDWTIESWNERFDELLTQEEIDGINKERNDFNKKLNEVLNEPTKEQNVQASVLDQSGTTDSDTKKGTEQVEKNDKQKEYKFNKRQRLGIPVNEAMQQLAEKDKANSVYSVTTNKELLAEANERIEKDIDEAYDFATQDDPKASQVKGMFATAGRLIPILENAIKNADSADAKAFWIDKLDFLRKYTQELAKTSGQSVQALVTVGNIMPMRDSVELIAIARREAFIKNGTKDGKFEESAKSGVKEDAEKVVDNIINNDSKVKELEAKIIELEGKIAGKKKAKRDEATKKAIEKIDSLIGKDFAFSDPLLIASAIQKGAVVLKTLIKGQAKVADAIDKAVAHINTLAKGMKWDEVKFRSAVNEQLSDVREILDELYDEKQATVKSRKQLKDSIRKGLISGDFSDLETLLKSKEMDKDGIDNYIDKLKSKHEDEVVFAVYKRVQKNLGLTPSIKRVKSAVEIDVAKEPLTNEEIEARLKKQIDNISAKVDKLRESRIEKNTATQEEIDATKKLKELEKSKKDLTDGQVAKKILDSEPLTEQEIISRLKKKKDALDKKIVDERAKRINKNLETTAEKQARQEKAKVEQSMKELSDVQIAKKMVSQEPLTNEEIEALFKKKNNLEDITPEQSEKLKELYDEVERVSGDVDLHKEALDKLRHEAQKLVPKTGWAAFMNAYDSIWHYPSILSGHMTQIANYADALMQSFTPDMISKTGRESFKDQFKGLKSAVNKAKIGLREGFLSEGLLNNGQPDKLNLSRKTAEDFAKEGNKIAKVTKWVGRVMSVPNTFGEAIKFNALSNIIQRDLIAKGLKGRELKDRKNELLFGTAAKMPEYEAMAVEMVYGKEQRDGNDVLKEAKVKRTISNLILEDMQKQMTTIEGQNAIETAERIKDIATYQNDATGLISILPRLVSSLENNKTFGEAIKFVNKKALRIDFLNTIANIANSKLNYLPPYGYLRANNISTSRIIKWAKPEWEGMLSHPDYSKPENSEEKRRILQKANIGTMIVVGASAKAILGAIKDEDDDKNKHRFITGDLTPSDIMDMASKHVHKKEAYESVPPNSIKLPVFGWTNYMLTPFAGALAMVGNLSDRMYANKHKELTKESIMADVMWAEARALKSIILDGTPLGSTIESNKPSKMTTTDNALQQVAVWGMTKTADIVGSSIPNLVKSIGKQIDPTLYTPKDLPTIIVKQMGLLNWYSAMGGELKTGYAVDILGNKTGTKSGDRYFNLLLEDHPEDKKLYDLLLGAYKEPMNYPALLSSNMAIRVELMNKEEHDKKLGIIKAKFEKGTISQVQMQNQLDALEKASKKDDDIGNNPKLYSEALEYCGKLFKEKLMDDYQKIISTSNNEKQKEMVGKLLKSSKNATKRKFKGKEE